MINPKQHSLVEFVASALAAPPDTLTVTIEQDGDGNKRTGEKSEQSACPAHAEFVVHRACEKREGGPKRRPDQVIAREDRRGVNGIRIRKVVEHHILWRYIVSSRPGQSKRWDKTYKEDEHARTKETRADNRHDPVHVWPGTPAEPKEGDGHYMIKSVCEWLMNTNDAYRLGRRRWRRAYALLGVNRRKRCSAALGSTSSTRRRKARC